MSNEDNTQVVDSAETTTELEGNETTNASTSESEATQEAESGEQHSSETAEQRSARLKRQVERAAKQAGQTVEEYLGVKGQESTEKGNQEGNQEGQIDERYARLELKTEGITSKKAQDVVIDYAEWRGIDPIEALKSPIVRAELAELEKKTAAPAPSKRTNGGASDSFEHWVSQAKKGNFPLHDREMMRKLSKARIFTS